MNKIGANLVNLSCAALPGCEAHRTHLTDAKWALNHPRKVVGLAISSDSSGHRQAQSHHSGRFRRFPETVYFLMLRFQAVTRNLLKVVERFGTWGLWHPHFYLHRFRTSAVPRSRLPTSACPFLAEEQCANIILLRGSVEYFYDTGIQEGSAD